MSIDLSLRKLEICLGTKELGSVVPDSIRLVVSQLNA